MAIRNSAKAIVISQGRILLNRCTSRFGEYYALPGGGQNPGETLIEAVRREVAEETGYSVRVLRMSGVYERIVERREPGDLPPSHKMYFIFLCSLKDPDPGIPTEHDRFQIGLEWVDLSRIRSVNLFPHAIRDNIPSMISMGETIYIGSEREKIV